MVRTYVVAFLLAVLLEFASTPALGTIPPSNIATNNLVTVVDPPRGIIREGFSLLMRVSAAEWSLFFSTISSIGYGAFRYGWQPLRKVYLQIVTIINDHDDLSKKIGRLYTEMTPNGGSSLCDSVRRMEVGIAKVESRHRVFLDSLHVIRFEADNNGDRVWVSAAYCELTGCTSTNALGSGWTNTLHPDDKDRVLKEWSSAVAGKRDFVLAYRIVNLHSQSEHKVRAQAFPLINPRTKAVEGFVGTLYPLEGEYYEKYKNKGYIW